ncbi:hypothetical protein DLAC_09836 [Tieghemostelium lacteum]|uniref:Uncharacterized protein n=1 Tax=Tieghemostelium lacteum TaxID=361077 RepID=A0A151Z7C3_TIELA|nr:hypothetical protein DLAC_09836 [Tieghemostelium lacteum]|eukprot:KYQ89861.1 hypothetical protein DLAC_09836 [Tieghemostelium lacteum]
MFYKTSPNIPKNDMINLIQNVYPDYQLVNLENINSKLSEYFTDIFQYHQFLDHFFKWIDDDNVDLDVALKWSFCTLVIEYIIGSKDHIVIQDRFEPWLTSKGTSKRDKQKLTLIAIQSLPKSLIYNFYKNGWFIRLFQCDDQKGINNIIAAMIILFATSRDDKDTLLYDHSLFPLTLISEAMNNRKIEMVPRFYTFITLINKNLYPKEKDFSEFDIESKSRIPMNVGFVRALIDVALTDDIEKAQDLQIEFFIRFICLNTFQNLKNEDIKELREEYLSLLPYIFKYNQISKQKQNQMFSYRRYYNGHLLRYSNNLGKSNLTEYKHYFSVDFIEKEAMEYFNNWTLKITTNSTRDLLNAMGTLNSIGLDSNVIKVNLKSIYGKLVKAIQVTRHQELLKQLCQTLEGLITLYKVFPSSLSNQTLDYLFNTGTLWISSKDVIDPKKQPMFDLFTAVICTDLDTTMERFGEIFGFIVDGDYFGTRLNILAHMLFTLDDRFKNLENFDEYYQELISLRKKLKTSIFFTPLCSILIQFNQDKTILQELVNLADNLSGHTKESYRVLILLFKSLDSDEKYLKLFSNALHMEFDRAGLLHIEKMFHVIYETITEAREVRYLFIEISKFLNIPAYRVNRFYSILPVIKYYYDVHQEIVEQFLNEFLSSLLVESYHTIETIKIYNTIKRFINIDDRVWSLVNNPVLVHYIEVFSQLVLSLVDVIGFYRKYIEQLPSKELMELHSSIFYSHVSYLNGTVCEYPDIHETFLEKCLGGFKFHEQAIEGLYKFIDFFKDYKSTSTQSFESIQEKMINLFKNQSDQRKRLLLKYIKNIGESLENGVLKVLFDEGVTGYHFQHTEADIEFNQTSLIIQNTIIHYILSHLFKSIPKASEILRYARVSKTFFKESQKLCKYYPIKKKLNYKFRYDTDKSLLKHGVYHLKYSSLSHFEGNDRIEKFYQLSSLEITNNFQYLVNRELNNLNQLVIVKITDWKALNISAIENLLKHCYYIQSFELEIFDHANIVPLVKVLLHQNQSLKHVIISIKRIEYYNQNFRALSQMLHDYKTLHNHCTYKIN